MVFICPLGLKARTRNNTLAWHDRLTKRKKTGGKKRAYRTKRIYEHGSQPVETLLGEAQRKTVAGITSTKKIKLVRADYVNVSNPETGKTLRLEILDVVSNPAKADYNRRGVITKGTIVRTENGLARIVSRPGQEGSLSAVVVEE
jgi:small subunit ribosomal protein S8e